MQQDEYAYCFENVMNHAEMKKLFAAYLKKQALCEESFLFHERVLQFKQIQDTEKMQIEAKVILDSFIESDSDYELNLAASTKASLLEQVEYNSDMFDTLLATVKMELKDHYTRFMSSKDMIEYIDACVAKQLLESMLTKTLQEKETKVTLAVDFSTTGIAKKDVNLLDKLLDNDRWQLLEGKPDFATFQSVDKYHMKPNEKGVRLLKTTGIVPYTFAQVLNNFASRSTKYDNYMNKHDQVAFEPKSGDSDYPISIIMETFPAIWPVTNRDFVKAYTVIHRDSAKRYAIIFKSVPHKLCPVRKGTIRGIKFGIISIEMLHNYSTRYTYLTYTDMQTDSYASKLYWNKMMQTRMKGMHQGILKSLADPSENAESLGILETLAENVKHEYINRRSISFDELAPPLKRLVYLSKCTVNLSDEELRGIAKKANENNIKYNVTGMLMYCKGVFYQVLEGEVDKVDFILSKIQKDPRHDSIRIVKEEHGLTENDRNYTNWSMNTVNLDTVSSFNPCAMIMKNVIHYLDAQNAFEEKQALEAITSLS